MPILRSNTLNRYYLKQWAWPFLGSLLFFAGLILAWEVLQISKMIFSQGVSSAWLFPSMLVQLPEVISMVVPMAAVLGGMMGSQHLSEGSEIVASQGLGVGSQSILKPWLLLSVIFLATTTFNAHYLVPKANTYWNTLQEKMLEEAKTRFLRPGAPPITRDLVMSEKGVAHSLWLSHSGEIHLMEAGPKNIQHMVAGSMEWGKQENNGSIFSLSIILRDLQGCGISRPEGKIHQQYLKEFSLKLPVQEKKNLFRPTASRHKRTGELLKDDSPSARLELALRLSLPFAACSLLMVGIALGLGHPRFQKGGAILKSLGVILAYYIFLEIAKSQIKRGNTEFSLLLLFLPWGFLAFGFFVLSRKLHPHHSLPPLLRWLSRIHFVKIWKKKRIQARQEKPQREARHYHFAVFRTWTQHLWWKNWTAAMATFLVLDLLMEFINIASYLSESHVTIFTFLKYWLYKLPPFLAVVLPIGFVFASVLAISEATVSREWVAMKAGGVSFLQWVRSCAFAWGSVLILTFVLHAFIAPHASGEEDRLLRFIKGRPPRTMHSKPWLYLGSTGVLWHLDGSTRWGFPLKSPGTAPTLMKWEMPKYKTEVVAWNELQWSEGPEAMRLFPDRALREAENAEEADTLALLKWQQWAPDPERAFMLIERLLSWITGPFLLFALLPFAFPQPRRSRGSALGIALVGSLLFLGIQAVFSGAAKAGEIPALWGVAAPILALFSFGMINLHKVRT